MELVADVNDFYSPELEFQMAIDAWASDYPAASNFITNRFMCGNSYFPSAGFCDPRIDAMIDRATRLQLDDPAAAGGLWAEIDRAIIVKGAFIQIMPLTWDSFLLPVMDKNPGSRSDWFCIGSRRDSLSKT